MHTFMCMSGSVCVITHTRRGCSPRVEVVLGAATLDAALDAGAATIPLLPLLLGNEGATASAHGAVRAGAG